MAADGHIHGFSRAFLADFNAKFHALVDDGKLAGVVTLIARHGEIVNLDAHGVLDLSAAQPTPLQTDTIFRVASMAKPITAAAALMLLDEGRWALDDHVAKFVPEFANLQVQPFGSAAAPQHAPMTMRQLMTHSAGFGSLTDYPDLRGGSLQDMIDHLAGRPLFFQPGTEWRYGPGIDILGYIIQKLTGLHLDEFLDERILRPLGMVDSGYILPPSKLGRLVCNHKYDETRKLVAIDLPGSYNAERPKYLGGGGGFMLSTAKDYWRFSQMILNGGEFEGKRYLKASTVDMMHTNFLDPGVYPKLRGIIMSGLGFGLGYGVIHDSTAARTKIPPRGYWWLGIYGTWFWIDPVNDLIVVGLVNMVNPVPALQARELSIQLIYKALDEKGGTQAG
jgi:CubicO group peptidase (beta-lactamase class C family)